MTAFSGTTIALSIRDAANPTQYLPIGGLQRVSLRLAGNAVGDGALGGDAWRRLHAGVGERSLSLTGQGMFTASAGESQLFVHALAGTPATLRLQLASGDRLEGDFLVMRYQRDGDQESEVKQSLTLESAETITRVSA